MRNTFNYYVQGKYDGDNYIKLQTFKDSEAVVDRIEGIAIAEGYKSFSEMYGDKKRL